jgi:uncharacterized protein (TIGR00369 family)
MCPEPADPEFETRVHASFARQAVMATLGVTLERIAPGECVLSIAHRADLTQQHGFLHAGIVTTVLDSACGYAALSLMEPGAAVLSVEFKVNLLAPARGERFRAEARVVKAGRTLSVVTAELRARDAAGGGQAVVALMTGTMMTVRGRAGLVD